MITITYQSPDGQVRILKNFPDHQYEEAISAAEIWWESKPVPWIELRLVENGNLADSICVNSWLNPHYSWRERNGISRDSTVSEDKAPQPEVVPKKLIAVLGVCIFLAAAFAAIAGVIAANV